MQLGLSSLGRSLEEVPLAPVLSVLFGAVAAILVLATPEWMFDRMVVASGLPSLSPSVFPPFGEAARIAAAIVMMWLVAGILWPAFALASTLLAPKSEKGKGHRIEASFDAYVPVLEFGALIRAPLGSQPKPASATDTPDGQASSRIKAVVRRAANSNDIVPTKDKVPPEAEIGADAQQSAKRSADANAVASRTIEPRKYKPRKGHPVASEAVDANNKTLGGSETRH